MEVFKTKEVYKTDDYDQFKELSSNRPIDTNHVNRLKRLILKENKLSDNAIWINKDKQVLDGQHRLIAAKELSLPIYFEFIEGDLHDAKLFNIGRKDWSTKDFLYSFCKDLNQNYIYLKNFMEKYQLTLSISLRLLCGNGKNSENLLSFKLGQFKPVNSFNAELIGKRLLDLRPYLEKQVYTDREFLIALKQIYGKIGHDELLRKMEQSRFKLPTYKRTIDYIRALQDIYNYGRQKRISFE